MAGEIKHPDADHYSNEKWLADLVEKWRETALDPDRADDDELKLRRILADDHAREEDRKKKRTPDRSPVSHEYVLNAMRMVGAAAGLQEAYTKRLVAKIVSDQHQENGQLRRMVSDLQARVAALEGKGGKSKTSRR